VLALSPGDFGKFIADETEEWGSIQKDRTIGATNKEK
jgi:hypothetical protein